MEKMELFEDSRVPTNGTQDMKDDLTNVYKFLESCKNNTAESSDNVIKSLDNILTYPGAPREKVQHYKDVINKRLATELILIDLDLINLPPIEEFLNSF